MAGRLPTSWWVKFAEACRGIGSAWLGEINLRIHTAVAGAVIVAASVLGCEAWEWASLFLAVGLVLTSELLNTALERLFHALDDGAKQRVQGCLDVSAGAVLVAAMSAAGVGLVVFAPKLWALVR